MILRNLEYLLLRIARIWCGIAGHPWMDGGDEFDPVPSKRPNTGSWCARCGRGF